MSEQILKRGDPVTLLATGEHTAVMVAGKSHFTVRGHVLPYYVKDEGATWARRGRAQRLASVRPAKNVRR